MFSACLCYVYVQLAAKNPAALRARSARGSGAGPRQGGTNMYKLHACRGYPSALRGGYFGDQKGANGKQAEMGDPKRAEEKHAENDCQKRASEKQANVGGQKKGKEK